MATYRKQRVVAERGGKYSGFVCLQNGAGPMVILLASVLEVLIFAWVFAEGSAVIGQSKIISLGH